MKAISIKQPWVYAILHEGKDIENRTWRRDFRGWIAIHASGIRRSGAAFPRGHKLPENDEAPCSAICGVARVVDIVTKHRSKWFYRPSRGERVNYGWVLADVTAVPEPISCKGTLGLWEVPSSVLRSLTTAADTGFRQRHDSLIVARHLPSRATPSRSRADAPATTTP